MSANTIQPAQFLGPYELIYKIAEGGMGSVYKAKHRETQAIVAVKIIATDTARNALMLKRFEQEFKAASLIDHPNVVKAIDYCGSGPSPFLVMEFVDGETLGQKVDRDGALPETEAVRLISQVCEGLHRAHKQGLIHRDVKPDNILVTWEGVVKLTDLGLVKDVEAETNLTRTGRGLGTPHFMAPEQFRNAKGADVRCDIYSLGATLYMIVTGEIPFLNTTPLDCWMRKTKNDFPPPRSLNPSVSERVDWAVRRAMSSDPTARPASCREFMEDLTGAGWRAAGGSGAYTMAAPNLTNTGPPRAATTTDLWYLVYRDPAGQTHTVKGSTDSIRKNLAAGSLGDSTLVLVCRTKTGQFQPLRNIPEFRDLALGAAPLSGPELAMTVFPAPAVPAPSATIPTPPSGPKTDREQLGANDATLPQPIVPVMSAAPVLSAADLARPLERPPFAPPPAPPDRTTWAVLIVVVTAALLGLAFLLFR